MAIKTRRYAVTLGTQQEIDVAQGEDVLLAFAFTDPSPPLGTGLPISYANFEGAELIVKDKQGIELFGRAGVVVSTWAALTTYTAGVCVVNGGNCYECMVGGTSAASGGPTGTGTAIVDGTVTWQFLSALPQANDLLFFVLEVDTRVAAVQLYDCDVTWTESSRGYREQLLVASPFQVLYGVGEPGDPITSPIPVSVVYGYIGATFDTATATGATATIALPTLGITSDGYYLLKLLVGGRVGTDRAEWEFHVGVDVVSGISSIRWTRRIGPDGTSGAATWTAAVSTNGTDSTVLLNLAGTGSVVWVAYSELREM